MRKVRSPGFVDVRNFGFVGRDECIGSALVHYPFHSSDPAYPISKTRRTRGSRRQIADAEELSRPDEDDAATAVEGLILRWCLVPARIHLDCCDGTRPNQTVETFSRRGPAASGASSIESGRVRETLSVAGRQARSIQVCGHDTSPVPVGTITPPVVRIPTDGISSSKIVMRWGIRASRSPRP